MSGMGDVKLADQLLDQYQRQKSLDEEIRSKYPEYEKMYGESFWRKPVSDSYSNMAPSQKDLQEIMENTNSDYIQYPVFGAKRNIEVASADMFADKYGIDSPTEMVKRLRKYSPTGSDWEFIGGLGKNEYNLENPNLPSTKGIGKRAGDYTNYQDKFVKVRLDNPDINDAILHEYGHTLDTRPPGVTTLQDEEIALPYIIDELEKNRAMNILQPKQDSKEIDLEFILNNFPRYFKEMSGTHFRSPGVPMDENKIGGNEVSFSWEYPQKILKKAYGSPGLEQGIPEKMEKYKSLKPIFKDE